MNRAQIIYLMSYDLSFDRRTATLLAVCTAATVLLLVTAGFLLGAQYRREDHSTSVVPAKSPVAPVVPAAQKNPQPATPAPALVETSAPASSGTQQDTVPDTQASTPATPPLSAAAKSVSARTPALLGYSLQFGAFREMANAEAAVKELQGKKVKAEVVPRDDAAGDTWYTVRTGNYPTLSAASAAAVPLRVSTQQSVFVRPANRP